MSVRVRFAPSPTGFLHVGGARTVLFNKLLKENRGGQLILRIEDTDQTRYNELSVTDMLLGLKWLGIEFDEGPNKEELSRLGVSPDLNLSFPENGKNYVQTSRLALYAEVVNILLEEGHAYYVFADELDDSLVPKKKRKKGDPSFRDVSKDMNLEKWRNSHPAMSRALANQGRPYHVRLKMPRHSDVEVEDTLRGKIKFLGYKLRDPVILKTNGIPSYHLAVVVDDNDMRITNVLRGEEWLSSFPIHWYLYDLLGWNKPEFTHLPVILNPTGRGKMSKRETVDGTGKLVPVFVSKYKELGFVPEAMVNFMSLVGWNPKNEDGREIMSLPEIVSRFNLNDINKTGAAWDMKKLMHFNREYIKMMSKEDFSEFAMRFINGY